MNPSAPLRLCVRKIQNSLPNSWDVIPWSEIPHVKKALDEGRTIKFGFRVNDDKGSGCMELARRRSVAKISGNGTAFKVDWAEHWDNEIEFAFEK